MKPLPLWAVFWPGVLWATYGAFFFEESVFVNLLKFIVFLYIAMAPLIYYAWKK